MMDDFYQVHVTFTCERLYVGWSNGHEDFSKPLDEVGRRQLELLTEATHDEELETGPGELRTRLYEQRMLLGAKVREFVLKAELESNAQEIVRMSESLA